VQVKYSPVTTLQISKHVILHIQLQLARPRDVAGSPSHSGAAVKGLVDGGIVSFNNSEGWLFRCYLAMLEIFRGDGGPPPVERDTESRHIERAWRLDLNYVQPIKQRSGDDLSIGPIVWYRGRKWSTCWAKRHERWGEKRRFYSMSCWQQKRPTIRNESSRTTGV
jgi:hypothetical protein